MGFIKGKAYPIIQKMAKNGDKNAEKLLNDLTNLSQDETDKKVSELLKGDENNGRNIQTSGGSVEINKNGKGNIGLADEYSKRNSDGRNGRISNESKTSGVFNSSEWNNVNNSTFYFSLKEAKSKDKRKFATVEVHSLDYYKDANLFLDNEQTAGFAIKLEDGKHNIISVFNNSYKRGLIKEMTNKVREFAKENNIKTLYLDCYKIGTPGEDGVSLDFSRSLPNLYGKWGWEVMEEVDYDEQYENDSNRGFGKENNYPKIVFMKLDV